MEVREAKGGWRAEVVWRSPDNNILVVHDFPAVEGTRFVGVWHKADGVAYRVIQPRTIDQTFDLVPTTCRCCGR